MRVFKVEDDGEVFVVWEDGEAQRKYGTKEECVIWCAERLGTTIYLSETPSEAVCGPQTSQEPLPTSEAVSELRKPIS